MHSVLIQNHNAMESFQHFHPLFMDAINEGKISSCQWMEAGEIIETAVPELYQLIDGKEEWRAIIVRVDEESESADYPTRPGNPYDYLINREGVFVAETPIPLIRLTRMLGGIPTPPIRFRPVRIANSTVFYDTEKCDKRFGDAEVNVSKQDESALDRVSSDVDERDQTVSDDEDLHTASELDETASGEDLSSGIEKGDTRTDEVSTDDAGAEISTLSDERKRRRAPKKAPRIIYEPIVDGAEQAEYNRLCEKYHFDGIPPTEIILVSLCLKHEVPEQTVAQAWKNNQEIESSEFWKRNGYPSICRFLAYGIERKGDRQREADLFKLWTSVLLLATNEIDSSSLQAYRLHKIDVVLDKKEMEEVFQKSISRAKSAKQYIRRSIAQDLAERLRENPDLPHYELDASVIINLPKQKQLGINANAFGMVSKSSTSDFEKWNEMKTESKRMLDNALTNAERALDHTADRVRTYCHYTDEEVRRLDDYQSDDMHRALDETHENILTLRSELPGKNSAINRKLTEMDRAIKGLLQKHVTKEYAFWSFSAAAVLLVLSFVPALVYNIKYQWGSKEILGYYLVIGLSVLLIAELLILLIFRNKLRKKIREYNSFIKRIVTRIAENGARYSRYMSQIATYIHGSSYLSILRKKTFLRDESEYYKRNHLAALDAYILKLETWSISFHLDVDFEMEEMNEGLTINTSISPYTNPIYTFDNPGSYQVELNNSGDYMNSDFSFVKKIRIVREELYDGD